MAIGRDISYYRIRYVYIVFAAIICDYMYRPHYVWFFYIYWYQFCHIIQGYSIEMSDESLTDQNSDDIGFQKKFT